MTTPRAIQLPDLGEVILIKAKTLPIFLEAPVTEVTKTHIITGSGMGTVVVKISDYGTAWKLKSQPQTTLQVIDFT